MKRFYMLLTGLYCLSITNNSFAAVKTTHEDKDSIRRIMKKVADWQWNDIEKNGWKNDAKDWTSGVLYTGMVAWAKLASEERYWQKLIAVGERNQWQIGPHRHFADDYCVGQLYTQLYGKYRKPEFIKDFSLLADTLVQLPHDESLRWMNSIYHREWAWCDALYMAPAGLAQLSAVTNDPRYLELACKLWWKSSNYLYSPQQQLFFRDSRYFTQKEKNGAQVFWSRGNGWVLAGMANLLDAMPKNYSERKKFEKQFKEMAHRIAELQQADGAWHASLLDPQSYPVKETSGTALFCYALAWGINQKMLPATQYKPVVEKAWRVLVQSVHSDGKLGYVQPQGVAPEKVTADDTEYYGVGAFLLAGREMFNLK